MKTKSLIFAFDRKYLKSNPQNKEIYHLSDSVKFVNEVPNSSTGAMLPNQMNKSSFHFANRKPFLLQPQPESVAP